MNASEITFGIEIECYLPAGSIASVGQYHRGIQIPGFPAGWNAQHDGSLGHRSGRQAVEIVSPVLKGAEGLAQVKEVVAKLNAMNASVGTNCGFHVHVGFAGGAATLERLTTLVANHETALYAATGTKARERGTYCQPIREAFRATTFADNANRVAINGTAAGSRYHTLNLTNLARNAGMDTVEFRAFAGTLNFGKIVAYIRLCVGLVERAYAMKRVGKWDSRPPVETSPINRKGGVGQTEVTRLSYQLGWTKGRRKETYGELAAEGLPTIKQSKKELMRLARKYDAAT